MPHHDFSDQEWERIGTPDFAKAFEIWAAERGLFQKNNLIVTVGGMSWSYPSIQTARYFLFSKLLSSRDAQRNLFSGLRQIDPKKLLVAVHMRRGDFSLPQRDAQRRGSSNYQIAASWYELICENLQKALGNNVAFYIFSDDSGEEFQHLVRRFNPGQVAPNGLSDCSDIVLMAHADLRICSNSSYSLLANFLSNGPFIWFEPQLPIRDEYYLSSEQGTGIRERFTQNGLHYFSTTKAEEVDKEIFRCWPIDETGRLPHLLLERLHCLHASKQNEANIMEFGVIPFWALR